MDKKGQLTVIIIVGVVVIFAFVLVYFLKDAFIQKVVQTGDVTKRMESVLD